MVERITVDTSRQLDPRQLRDGEFGDTTWVGIEGKSPVYRPKKLSFYEQFRQDCLDRGLTEEGFKEEWRAYIACCGD